jgi:hypothetical protein
VFWKMFGGSKSGSMHNPRLESEELQTMDEERVRARLRAEEVESIVEEIGRDERQTIELLEKLDKLAASLFDHALEWDVVSADIAARVRRQEQEVREIRARVQALAEMQVDEVTAMMAEVESALRRAIGTD